jgi:hypothetical protein
MDVRFSHGASQKGKDIGCAACHAEPDRHVQVPVLDPGCTDPGCDGVAGSNRIHDSELGHKDPEGA